jgi:hypothetical protein
VVNLRFSVSVGVGVKEEVAVGVGVEVGVNVDVRVGVGVLVDVDEGEGVQVFVMVGVVSVWIVFVATAMMGFCGAGVGAMRAEIMKDPKATRATVINPSAARMASSVRLSFIGVDSGCSGN